MVEIPPSILPHQREAFRALYEIGSACFEISRDSLPLSPRTNTLVVGPTGTGKTFLARSVAECLNAPSFFVSVSEWMPLGVTQRGAVCTWPSICNFLLKHSASRGVVIFLDELCKLGNSSWDGYVKVEVFRLLDLNISRELTDEFSERMDADDHAKAEEVLRKRTFLIGAGAFQDIWEASSSTIGFSSQFPSPDISLNRLARLLPRELVNRFRSQIITLPALGPADYTRMLYTSAAHIPSCLRRRYIELGSKRVLEAARQQHGVRFLEELLLDTALLERSFMESNREHQLEFQFPASDARKEGEAPVEVREVLRKTFGVVETPE